MLVCVRSCCFHLPNGGYCLFSLSVFQTLIPSQLPAQICTDVTDMEMLLTIGSMTVSVWLTEVQREKIMPDQQDS